jgi:hypothetical protein
VQTLLLDGAILWTSHAGKVTCTDRLFGPADD